MTGAKRVVNYNGASHNSRPNSAQKRRNSRSYMQNNLVEATNFLTHIQYR